MDELAKESARAAQKNQWRPLAKAQAKSKSLKEQAATEGSAKAISKAEDNGGPLNGFQPIVRMTVRLTSVATLIKAKQTGRL